MNFADVQVVGDGSAILLDGGSFRLRASEKHESHLRAYVGKLVTLGIRPEDLPCSEESATEVIHAKVSVVEPLGADINLYVSTCKHRLTARIAPHHLYKIGDEVSLAPVMGKVRYFDQETGNAIITES